MNVIEFENISKQYRLGLVSTGTIAHDLNRWWTMNILGKEDPYLKIGETNDRAHRGNSDYVWALKDINFSVEESDVVGIIGKNGSGKSTLLKILSRVTTPTTGEVRVRGRIASLLEVGTGFHPEMTGRENIYLNGAIMGMTKEEISRKFDEIVDFSGCERYIDTPVKRYSSGMTVRLGFAVAAHLEPEILVVDEVLAVGDAEFQKKAIGKMHDISHGEGRTVLFVSHNMNSVKMLCNKGVVLKDGMLDMIGSVDECVDHYIQRQIADTVSHTFITNEHRSDRGRFKRELEFMEAWLLNPNSSMMANDEPLLIRLKVKRNSPIAQAQFNVIILNGLDVRVAFYHPSSINIPDQNEFFVNIQIPHPALPRGVYQLRFEAVVADFSSASKHFDVVSNVLSFNIKYIHSAKKDEFLHWNYNWGNTFHENEGIDVSIK